MSRHLEDQAAALYPVVTVNGRDTMAWAKRLHWREQQGDKTISPIQAQFAREALGMVKEQAK